MSPLTLENLSVFLAVFPFVLMAASLLKNISQAKQKQEHMQKVSARLLKIK